MKKIKPGKSQQMDAIWLALVVFVCAALAIFQALGVIERVQ